MKLYYDVLAQLAIESRCQSCIMRADYNRAVERTCFDALKKIKTVVEDDSMEDRECFRKIEEIVGILEEIGSDGGTRHDFG